MIVQTEYKGQSIWIPNLDMQTAQLVGVALAEYYGVKVSVIVGNNSHYNTIYPPHTVWSGK